MASNAAGGTLAVPAVDIVYGSGSGWLLTDVTGSSPAYTITVSSAAVSPAPGVHTATITATCEGALNSPQTIAVTSTVFVAGTPLIELSEPSLAFLGFVGMDPATAQAFTITNPWSGTLDWVDQTL